VGRLPNLLIVGVPKAGTGSLFAYLAQHDDVCASSTKEIGYFTPLREAGRDLAPVDTYERYFSNCGDERYAMEATPSYSFGGERVRDAIRRVLGRPRILIVLREPIERLWSAYTFQRSLGNLPSIRSFEDYVAACERRRSELNGALEVDGHLNGLSIGFYGDYIPTWLDEFGEDVHVVFFDELTRDPSALLRRLCTRLGIDPALVDRFDLSARNVTSHPRSTGVARTIFAAKRAIDRVLPRTPALRAAVRSAYVRINAGRFRERLDPATRDRLEATYRPSTVAMYEALRAAGYADELPAWLSAAAAS
jgi:Sulfotransferase domain